MYDAKQLVPLRFVDKEHSVTDSSLATSALTASVNVYSEKHLV